jgi:hypothetical protein
MKFIDMVSIFFTFKAGWLLYIHFFFYWTIQEGALDAHLIKLKTMVSSIGKEHTKVSSKSKPLTCE